ncbi:MAG TPA: GNAT family N-acetyltransferase [Mycobacteriales bacterium]|nr:GNAT family N-acetyltransferase [Mycobacteriales bacterium]
MLTVRARADADAAAVAALLAATADRTEALDPAIRLARRPGSGPALVAVGADGALHGHVRPVEQVLDAEDPDRAYGPDRSVSWFDAAATGPDAIAALAAAIRATPVGAEADGVLWPAVDEGWWAGIGLEPSGHYCLRPPVPLPGPLPGGVTTRAAGPDDVEAVVALHREAVAFQAAASPYVRQVPAAEAGFRSRLSTGTSSSTLLEAGGRPIAVCEWWPVDGGEPDRPALLPPGRYVYLNSVAVTAGARGSGLGRALVSAALAAADAPDGSTLWFSPSNPIASRVWPHLGWRPIWSAWERRS